LLVTGFWGEVSQSQPKLLNVWVKIPPEPVTLESYSVAEMADALHVLVADDVITLDGLRG
jgi:hypothetical protein